jgi:hypothetical protein
LPDWASKPSPSPSTSPQPTLSPSIPEFPAEFDSVLAELLRTNKPQLCSMNQISRNNLPDGFLRNSLQLSICAIFI